MDTNNFKDRFDGGIGELLNQLVESTKKLGTDKDSMFLNGVVVDNEDPDEIGRVRVRIAKDHSDEIPNSDIPWAIPHKSNASSGMSSLIIPRVGDTVRVYYDQGDRYSPVYMGKISNKEETESSSSNYQDDYPNTQILWESPNGDYISKNLTTGTMTMVHESGTIFSIDKLGNTYISSEGGATGVMHVNGKLVKVGAEADTEATEPFVQGLAFMQALTSWVSSVTAHTHNGIAPPDASIGVASAQFITEAFASLTLTTMVKKEP